MVPTDHASLPESEEEAAALALNRTTELGGWDEASLANVLSDLAAADALEGVGWDAEDVDEKLRGFLEPEWDDSALDQSGELREGYQVLVECASEEEQANLLERLDAEGFRCRSLIS